MSTRPHERRFARAALAVALLALPTLVPSPVSAQIEQDPVLRPGVQYDWWNATWHFRVPILVHPHLPDPFRKGEWIDLSPGGANGGKTGLVNYPVEIDLDFTKLVRSGTVEGARWPQDALGRLSSFTLDVASPRVVAYNRDSGKVDAAQGVAGLMPSRFHPGVLRSTTPLDPAFNASTNAIGTLAFVVGQSAFGPAKPFDRPLLYYVYFDIVQNGNKPLPKFTEAQMGLLDGMYWIRSGTTFYGWAPANGAEAGAPAVLDVMPHFPNTTVRLYRYRLENFEPDPIPLCGEARNNPPCIPGNEKTKMRDGGIVIEGDHFQATPLTVTVVNGDQDFYFKVVASKPVTVSLRQDYLYRPNPPETVGTFYPTATVVPAVDGGIVGRRFHFLPASAPQSDTSPTPMYIVALDGPTEVRIFDARVSQSGPRWSNRVPKETPVNIPSATLVGSDGSPMRIEAEGRIMVFTTGANDNYLYQMPSKHGAPAGTQVYGAFARSFVTTAYAPTEFIGTRMVSPTCDQLTTPPQLGRIPYCDGTLTIKPHAVRSNVQSQNTHNDRAEPWTFYAVEGGPISVASGRRGYMAAGGLDGGRVFEVRIPSTGSNSLPGWMNIFPVHNNTVVTVKEETLLANGTTQFTTRLTRTLNQNDYVWRQNNQPIFRSGAKDAFFRVEASKPVLVNVYTPGSQLYGTFYQGTLAPVKIEVGIVNFYGNLVAWKERTLSGTFKPGDTAKFTLTAVNLGRGLGNTSITDDFEIDQDFQGSTQKWRVTVSTAIERSIPTGGTRDVTVAIRIDPSVKTGEQITFNLTLTSGANPRIQDTARVTVSVQTRYDFQMSFVGRVAQAKTSFASLQSAGTHEFTVLVKNTGTGADNVTLSVSPGGPGGFPFTAEIVDAAGRRIADSSGLKGRVALPEKGETEVKLRVRAPRNDLPLQWEFVVQGASVADASTQDQVTATVSINIRTDLRVDAENSTFRVTPGTTTHLPIKVTNLGSDTEVVLGVVSPAAPDWTYAIEPSRVTLRGQGDSRVVNLSVLPGPSARVGQVLPFQVKATALTEEADGGLKENATRVTAIVVNNFTLVVPTPLPRSLDPGAKVSFDFEIASRANGAMRVSLVPSALPPGWSFAEVNPPGTFDLLPGEARAVSVVVAAKPNEDPGEFAIGVGFLLSDAEGSRHLFEKVVAARVKRFFDYEAIVESDGFVRPGGKTRVALAVTNTGNGPEEIVLETVPPPGWTMRFERPDDRIVRLEPGQSTRVAFEVTAPRNATSDSARLEVRGVINQERERVTPIDLVIERLDLSVVKVDAKANRFAVGETVLFEITVLNNGTVPASRVEVALVADGQVVKNATLESLAPNEARKIQLPWNVIRASTFEIAIDPSNRFHEENRANNALKYDLSARSSGAFTPVPAFAIVVAALGAALLLRRRVAP
ncbi:MAG TPA: NEW3 domain-containing protein [Candidatus Thermoplasmatota archaeon]|nr:NEW3 domain-containing protein [Candidatus Thermoplasmatota archaeon]